MKTNKIMFFARTHKKCIIAPTSLFRLKDKMFLFKLDIHLTPAYLLFWFSSSFQYIPSSGSFCFIIILCFGCLSNTRVSCLFFLRTGPLVVSGCSTYTANAPLFLRYHHHILVGRCFSVIRFFRNHRLLVCFFLG
jgi:hypothetical protein